MIYDFFNPYGGLNTMSDNYVTGDNIYERELQNFFFQTLGMMSITHYGAIGDGRRDNYGPLQVAIDDANRRGLNYIYVPFGRYIYTGELLHEGSVTFVGNPHAKIINIRTGKEIPIGQFGSSLGIETMRYDLHKMALALSKYINYTSDIDQGYYYTIDEDNTLKEKEKQWTANFVADARVLYSRVKIKGQCLSDSMYYVVDEEGNVLYASPKGMRFTELTEIILNIPFGARQVVFNFTNIDQNIPELWLLDIVTDFYTKEEIDTMLAEKQDNLVAGEGITIDNNVISATGEISGTPFATCPFPTVWGGTTEQQTDTGTTSIGTWTISTDATPEPESGTKISYAFDRDDSTYYRARLESVGSTDPDAGPRYIEIALPSSVSIRPVEIYLKINNVYISSTHPECRSIIQGYNEATSEWEDFYTITEIPHDGNYVVGMTVEVSVPNYYTKFRVANMYRNYFDGTIYDFQVRSGYIKIENNQENPID